MKLLRKNTDLQSFVGDATDEDDDDHSSIPPLDSILPKAPTQKIDIDIVDDKNDLTEINLESTAGTNQTESLESIARTDQSSDVNVWDYIADDDDDNNLQVSADVGSSSLNILDYLVIPQRAGSIDGLNPFYYQDRDDVWTIGSTTSFLRDKSPSADGIAPKATEILSKSRKFASFTGLSPGGMDDTLSSSNSDGQPENKSSPDSSEETKPCPIFAWESNTTVGIQIDVSHSQPGVPDRFKDIDSKIQALLEDQDELALWSVKHAGELAAVQDVPEFSRVPLEALMARAQVKLIQLDEHGGFSEERAKWGLKSR
ncbi:uncharacterized protein N7483_005871 [Penicillium malachiteum]|uniref:uncharacterized protein n=1 Tax=Penicillium malachiteum TaxID=1324776 RepID=UPI00254779AF|nr:uncharacterized protein N7483_005871 [Penicillium malachiteum]KAJ5731363.1 hypothetical protein N7483_005871 [Penicillium malachiteum]